jgi:type VI secretion system protein ImpM
MSGDSLNSQHADHNNAGYFGKVPSDGDFVLDGLPNDFVGPWQEWVQLALGHSRRQLADSWLDAYLTSPVWYFALAPSLCGDRSWAGVLMPSVDADGRYFPLTIAAPLAPEARLFDIFAMAADWFGAAENLARSCLSNDFALDVFEQGIRSLGRPGGRKADFRQGQDEETLSNAWRFGLDSPQAIEAMCPAALEQLMDQLLLSYSFWWSSGSDRVAPTLLVSQGLPPPGGYTAMLDGEWARWGWRDSQVLQNPGPPAER